MIFLSIMMIFSNLYVKFYVISELVVCLLFLCCEEELFIKMVVFCFGGIKYKIRLLVNC